MRNDEYLLISQYCMLSHLEIASHLIVSHAWFKFYSLLIASFMCVCVYIYSYEMIFCKSATF